MNGERLKRLMRANGLTNNDVAQRMNMTAQNLSALLSKDDIKTNFLERFAEALGTTPAEIYGDTINTALASNHSTAVAGNGSAGIDAALLDKAMNENARLLEQNSRLLGIIEKLQQ
jgi:transcriptional regulator with XRE-family HTH domain